MKRREFMAGSAAGVAGLRARDASASTLLPCINQVTTLAAAFDTEPRGPEERSGRHGTSLLRGGGEVHVGRLTEQP